MIGIGLLAGALWVGFHAAVAFGQAVGTAFSMFQSASTGPLNSIGGLFQSWGRTLREIFELMKTDMPGAIKVGEAAFELAIEQIKELFPPLWEFMKKGFAAAWEFMSEKAAIEGRRATQLALHSNLIPGFDPGGKIQQAVDNINKKYDNQTIEAFDRLGGRLGKAAQEFSPPNLTGTAQDKERWASLRAQGYPGGPLDKPDGMSAALWKKQTGVWKAQEEVRFNSLWKQVSAKLFMSDMGDAASQVKNLGNALPDQTQMAKAPQLVGAYQQGSVGAADLLAKFQAENQLSGQDTMLAKVDRTNQLLEGVQGAVENVGRAVGMAARPIVVGM